MLVRNLRDDIVELFVVLDVYFAIVEASTELVGKLRLGLIERLTWLWSAVEAVDWRESAGRTGLHAITCNLPWPPA